MEDGGSVTTTVDRLMWLAASTQARFALEREHTRTLLGDAESQLDPAGPVAPWLRAETRAHLTVERIAQGTRERTFAGPRGPRGGSACHTRPLHLHGGRREQVSVMQLRRRTMRKAKRGIPHRARMVRDSSECAQQTGRHSGPVPKNMGCMLSAYVCVRAYAKA